MKTFDMMGKQGLSNDQGNAERFKEKNLFLRDTLENLHGSIDNVEGTSEKEPKFANKSEAKRPDNEPSFLRDFDYIGIPEDGTDIYKTVNPNFGKEAEYNNNCVRCIGAEEMKWRGYDVEAMPHNENDPVKSNGGSFWNVDTNHYKKDKYGFNLFETPEKAVDVLMDAFSRWGDGSRAMMGIRWKDDKNHALFVRREGKKIIFEDPQSGKIWDPMKLINQMSTKENTSFIMRVDNRPFNENIKYVVRNRERK